MDKENIDITNKEEFWACKIHNSAGNTEMGCGLCYQEEEKMEAYLKSVKK